MIFLERLVTSRLVWGGVSGLVSGKNRRLVNLDQALAPVVVFVDFGPKGLEDGQKIMPVVREHGRSREMGEVTWEAA
jgi:hypothetical protein